MKKLTDKYLEKWKEKSPETINVTNTLFNETKGKITSPLISYTKSYISIKESISIKGIYLIFYQIFPHEICVWISDTHLEDVKKLLNALKIIYKLNPVRKNTNEICIPYDNAEFIESNDYLFRILSDYRKEWLNEEYEK